MPPHYTPSIPTLIPRSLWRAGKILLLASALALTGCAANQNAQQQAENSAHLFIRDSYLSKTKSDPLGAYLASRDFNRALAGGAYSEPRTPTLVGTALGFLGVKYKYGGESPNTGFDCSGLVSYAAEKSLGLKLPRRSADIARQGISVKRSELKRGDLVFFNTRGSRFSHVGIYLGDHKFVHAPRTGAVVRIEDMNIAYWKKRYNGARRLVATNTASK
ncbi:cell wall-associated NlpC family hydrolase [Pusillimonas noertemannii]|uniref:Cell wall-associated NlpC family hydrolase n=1 Tax=Pusillimonas noertemannii TaxID=305977 RepID=A0A2U1CS89_9BURK|nr:C40 family peptidase [Pusillimonas noertemannii]PVY68767.1 cell wall-associated NlpC family hydrolase [Pusillimonas noertemannii]TFL11776.1 peptidoglycan endopeptidase [Pusillimonas noertemannii]